MVSLTMQMEMVHRLPEYWTDRRIRNNQKPLQEDPRMLLSSLINLEPIQGEVCFKMFNVGPTRRINRS